MGQGKEFLWLHFLNSTKIKANSSEKLSVDVREVTLIHGSHQLVYKFRKKVLIYVQQIMQQKSHRSMWKNTKRTTKRSFIDLHY